MIPILYESQHISIQTLWVFVAIALLFSSYLVIQRLKRKRVNFTLLIQHNARFLLTALFFSRLVYFLVNTDTYFPGFDLRTLINFFSIWDQGLSLWGGMFGFCLALGIQLWREEEDFSKWADALMIPFLLGVAIGNVGSFLGGYGYGTPTNLPWGIRYEIANVRYTVAVHPTQIYLIFLIVALIFIQFQLEKRTQLLEKDGNSALFLCTGFSLITFLLEFLRGDVTLLLWGVRLPLFVAGISFFISLFFFLRRLNQPKTSSDEPTPST